MTDTRTIDSADISDSAADATAPPATAREAIVTHRLCIIYRGLSARQCLEMTRALYDAGVRLFEVTFNSDEPEASITLLRERIADDAWIGAGTVMSPAEVQRAHTAGAQYIISPNLDPAVVAATREAGLASVPGAFTPTEVVQAVRAGADLVKVFPLRPVGADYIRQLRGPLNEVPVFASGGVDAALAREATEAGCVAVGVGQQMLGPDPSDTDQVVRCARAFLDAVGRPA